MNKILEVKFGSHLYGTNTPESDLDLKAIFLPTARQIVMGGFNKSVNTSRPKQPFERNHKDDVDMEAFSLDLFVVLLSQGQTVALDMLFAPLGMCRYASNDIWMFSELYNNRIELLNRNVNSFVGYAKQQAAKYGLKGFRVSALRATTELFASMPQHDKLGKHKDLLEAFVNSHATDPDNTIRFSEHVNAAGASETLFECCDKKVSLNATVKYGKAIFDKMFQAYGHRALLAEKNEGVDWKALSHAVRVNSEAIELLTTAQITFPRPDRALLLQIKRGELPYKQVADIIEEGLKDLKSAQEVSILQDTPDFQWAEDFIFEVYSSIVKKG